MCYQREVFSYLQPVHIPIKLGDGTIINARGKGNISNLTDIYYVPDLKFNLLSVSYLTNLGFIVSFSPTGTVNISDKHGNIHEIGAYENGTYHTKNNLLDFNNDQVHSLVTSV
jgi:hypothetical protein